MTTANQTPLTLREALQSRKISITNRAFLEPLCDWNEIAECFVLSGYIKATRRSGGPDVRIHSGYTTGFQSDEEIVKIFGDVDRWLNEPLTDWLVTHPENSIRNSNSSSTKQQNTREQPLCPNCFTYMSLSGICGSCD